MNGWQPIETAPLDGTRILVYAPWLKQVVIGRWWRARWTLALGGYTANPAGEPTHWMPLPDAPEAA